VEQDDLVVAGVYAVREFEREVGGRGGEQQLADLGAG